MLTTPFTKLPAIAEGANQQRFDSPFAPFEGLGWPASASLWLRRTEYPRCLGMPLEVFRDSRAADHGAYSCMLESHGKRYNSVM